MNELEIIDIREHYFKVSNHIYDHDLSIYELGVYTCLCRFANNDNTESFPSISTIQKMLKISRPKVINSIKQLVEKQIVYKKMGHTGKSNRYYLLNLPSKRHLLVNEINQGSKPHLPTSKPRLPEVVNEVYSKKTYIKKTNKKTKGKTDPIFYDEWDQVMTVARNGGTGYKNLNSEIKYTIQSIGGLSRLKEGNNYTANQMKFDYVNLRKKMTETT